MDDREAHSQVGTCTTSGAAGAAARSGIDSTCVKTLMSYSLGFVFVASGVIIAVIAATMIGRQAHLDLHGELKAVPRTWAKREYVTTSDGLRSAARCRPDPRSTSSSPPDVSLTGRSTASRRAQLETSRERLSDSSSKLTFTDSATNRWL